MRHLTVVTNPSREIEYLNVNHGLTQDFYTNGAGNPDRVSGRYLGIDNKGIEESFNKAGFITRSIDAPLARKHENKAFNQTIMRFTTRENYDLLTSRKVGEIPEIVVLNNNNNRGATRVMLGMYRIVCQNGMILGDSFFDARVHHNKNIVDNMFIAMNQAANNFDRVRYVIDEMKGKHLDKKQILDFKHRVIDEVILPYLYDKNTISIRTSGYMGPKRFEDFSDSAWVTMNRVQEYAIMGGLKYVKRLKRPVPVEEFTSIVPTPEIVDGNYMIEDVLHNTTRAIRSAKKKIDINKAVMDIAFDQFNIAV